MLRARVVAWLVLGSYYFTLALAYIYDLPSEIRAFYTWLYGLGSIFPITVLIALYISRNLIWRFLLPLVATTPVFIETARFYPLNGTTFWWSVFVAGYASILFFERNERTPAFLLPVVVGVEGMIFLAFYSEMPHLPANPISHGAFRYGAIHIAMIGASVIGVAQYVQLRTKLLDQEKELLEVLSEQEKANAQLLAEKELSEQRRQQIEAALTEIERLREEEQQSRERAAFLVRYETLMRKGYTLSPAEFAEQLLHELSKDIACLGGLFYTRDNQGWIVQASYAFPDKIGTRIIGGPLRIAEVVRQPYLIAPAPAQTVDIRSLLVQPRPKGVLYLPFYSEVTQKVTCIVELFLAESLKPETSEKLEALLPRIGTYWWVRHETLRTNDLPKD